MNRARQKKRKCMCVYEGVRKMKGEHANEENEMEMELEQYA